MKLVQQLLQVADTKLYLYPSQEQETYYVVSYYFLQGLRVLP